MDTTVFCRRSLDGHATLEGESPNVKKGICITAFVDTLTASGTTLKDIGGRIDGRRQAGISWCMRQGNSTKGVFIAVIVIIETL